LPALLIDGRPAFVRFEFLDEQGRARFICISEDGAARLFKHVSMLIQAISLALLCLGVAAFVADSALGPPMLATAIAGWLVMPDALMHR
jgi:hypothetical protein